ncbi:hypothetical protein B0O80DRAFT_457634 [Mortierella sp. GBAus27b]|nr:hypothetical protein B0O80DRAFT_457634 [Mortierella sp. GBAus27b]
MLRSLIFVGILVQLRHRSRRSFERSQQKLLRALFCVVMSHCAAVIGSWMSSGHATRSRGYYCVHHVACCCLRLVRTNMMLMLLMVLLVLLVRWTWVVKVVGVGRERLVPKRCCSGVGTVAHVT